MQGSSRAVCVVAALLAVAYTLFAGAAPPAVSAATPKIYLKVAGYRAAVDFSPPGTLVTSDCSTYCGFSFPLGTTAVTLTARPAVGTSFVGWTQAFNGWTPPCTGNAPVCTINLVSSVAVKAAFDPVSLSWRELNGWGSVEFLDSRPTCGYTCRLYPYDAVAHVLAHANDGYAFDGWSGICSSSPSCNLRTNANGILTPTFHCTADACSIGQPYSNPTKVTVQVYGRGKVVGSRINCPGVLCTRTLESATTVSLGAVSTGGAFRGWSFRGVNCSTRAPRCTFSAFHDARTSGPRLVAFFS